MTLEFFMPCVPPTTTHQSKKIVRIAGFPRIGDTPELQAAKQAIDSLLLPHQPATPVPGGFGGALVLSLEFVWPWLSAAPKRVRACGRYPKTTKPDCSNLAKTIEDRLTALRFMGDDATVARLEVEKWYSDAPGIRVRITALAEPASAQLCMATSKEVAACSMQASLL